MRERRMQPGFVSKSVSSLFRDVVDQVLDMKPQTVVILGASASKKLDVQFGKTQGIEIARMFMKQQTAQAGAHLNSPQVMMPRIFVYDTNPGLDKLGVQVVADLYNVKPGRHDKRVAVLHQISQDSRDASLLRSFGYEIYEANAVSSLLNATSG